MKKILPCIIAITLVLGLTGCGTTVGDINLESGESAIYVQEDGTVSYAVAESFDKDYYDEGDLGDAINEEVEEYNNSNFASVNSAITVSDFSVKNDVATMVLDFATDYDFLEYIIDYNRVSEDQFYIGDIGKNSSCKIKGTFISADNNEAIKGKEIREMTDLNIIIVNEVYKVQIDGTLEYYSDNCSVDEDDIITTSDDGLSYIVYE